jgi:hypothetical protein
MLLQALRANGDSPGRTIFTSRNCLIVPALREFHDYFRDEIPLTGAPLRSGR